MRHLAISLCALGVMLVAPARAAAEDASALLKRGQQQFSEARFKAAIVTLETGRRATRDAKLLGQIYLYLGLSNAVIGNMDRARECFATALGHDPTVKLDFRRFKEDLVKLLEEVRAERVGTLRVTAEGEGATAVIDGGQPRALPLTISLVAGPHSINVRGPDGKLWRSETITVVASKTMSLPVLAPRADLQPASAPARQQQPSFWKRRRIWTWVALGSAVALGVAAGACAAKSDAICGDRLVGDQCSSLRDLRREEQQEQIDKMDRLNNAAWAMLGIGGGLVVTSVVLLFLEGRPTTDTNRRSLRFAPLLGQANGLQLVGHF